MLTESLIIDKSTRFVIPAIKSFSEASGNSLPVQTVHGEFSQRSGQSATDGQPSKRSRS